MNDPAATLTVVTGLTSGLTYTFAVRASSNVGPSGFSNSRTGTPLLEVLGVMSWNLKRGIDQGGPIIPFDPNPYVAAIESWTVEEDGFQVDVIGFQEIQEEQATRLRDQLGWAEAIWYQTKDVCPLPFQRCVGFGNAILSRYPLQDVKQPPWPLSDFETGSEQRLLLRASVMVGGEKVYIYNTHLSSGDATDADREFQANEVLGHIAEDRSSEPGVFRSILVCDCNARPGSPAHVALTPTMRDAWLVTNGGGGETASFDENGNPTARLDYVFVQERTGVPITAAFVDRHNTEGLSDHYPVIAKL